MGIREQEQQQGQQKKEATALGRVEKTSECAFSYIHAFRIKMLSCRDLEKKDRHDDINFSLSLLIPFFIYFLQL